jgi:AcrR family transcriptional regulator
MGRPREHDQRTADVLLRAAEQIVEANGLQGLSVRRVADLAGTSTRAVYSVFGSMDGLIVALGVHAFDLLGAGIRALPASNEPAADLMAAALSVFRRFVIEHPCLFRLAVQQTQTPRDVVAGFVPAASRAMLDLKGLVARLDAAGGLGGRTVDDAAAQFHALCEGMAALELRCMLSPSDPERQWREAFTALITGFASTVPGRQEDRHTADGPGE